MGRYLTTGIVLLLITYTSALSFLLGVFDLPATLSQFPVEYKAIIYISILFITAIISESSDEHLSKRNKSVASIMISLVYSLAISEAIYIKEITFSSQVVIGLYLLFSFYVLFIAAYGYKSEKLFNRWRAEALFLQITSSIFLISGLYVPFLLYFAIMCLFMTMTLETLYTIGRTKIENAHPTRDGFRIFNSLLGFPAILAVYLVRIIVRS